MDQFFKMSYCNWRFLAVIESLYAESGSRPCFYAFRDILGPRRKRVRSYITQTIA